MIKINKYLDVDYIQENIPNYMSYIEEYISQNEDIFLYSQKRDNCGCVASEFLFFMEKKGIKIIRASGDFVCDKGVFEKKDFFKEEIIQMNKEGFNSNLLEDRFNFSLKHGLLERQKKIPHYWNEDSEGNIIDLSGFSQFVKTGLASNLNKSRYLSEKNNLKFKI